MRVLRARHEGRAPRRGRAARVTVGNDAATAAGGGGRGRRCPRPGRGVHAL